MEKSKSSVRKGSVSELDTMTPAQNARPPAPVPPKKAKGKKGADPTDASKQIAAKIAQLEMDAAGEKDQDAEIGGLSSAT